MVSFGIGSSAGHKGGGIYGGNLSVRQMGALDSAKDRLQRQQKAANEVAFWEKQKETLKETECKTVEEIAKKLEKFHTYEDQIAAVKQAYNNEQMYKVLEEAQEQGEKNAEAVEKTEPKTEEERKEELQEEAVEAVTGEEASDGMLSEMMDAVQDLDALKPEELEKVLEAAEQITENIPKDEAAPEPQVNVSEENQKPEEFVMPVETQSPAALRQEEELQKLVAAEQQKMLEAYIPFDRRV